MNSFQKVGKRRDWEKSLPGRQNLWECFKMGLSETKEKKPFRRKKYRKGED